MKAFSMKMYCVFSLGSTDKCIQHTIFIEDRKDIPKFSPFAIWTGSTITSRKHTYIILTPLNPTFIL